MKKSLNLIVRLNFIAFLGLFLLAPSVFGKPVCTGKVKLPNGLSLPVVNTSTPQCKSAKEAFAAAIVIVTGNTADARMLSWLDAMTDDPVYAAKFEEGLGFADAAKWLKARIASDPQDRAFAIDNAFRVVYGRKSTSVEQAGWDAQVKAQKAWYAPIVLGETEKLNSSGENRVIPIQQVYIISFGREPSADEMNYWKPRKEHFSLMMLAARNFLYSSKGAKDLSETVARAIKFQNKTKFAADDEIKKTMIKYADKKLIYWEMIGVEDVSFFTKF